MTLVVIQYRNNLDFSLNHQFSCFSWCRVIGQQISVKLQYYPDNLKENFTFQIHPLGI